MMRALEERAASVVGKEVARGAAAKGATEKEAGTPNFCGELVIRYVYIYIHTTDSILYCKLQTLLPSGKAPSYTKP